LILMMELINFFKNLRWTINVDFNDGINKLF
jgi:hypothetical protein